MRDSAPAEKNAMMFIMHLISTQRKSIFLFVLSGVFLITLALWHSANNLSKLSLLPDNFEARQSKLVYSVKPWCLAEERKVLEDFEMNEVQLQSYCACIVGRIDHTLKTEDFDQIYELRTHPYVTVKLQLFRKQCAKEIR
jgi:hypothetical protein